MHTITFLKQYKKYRDKIYTYFLYRVNFDTPVAEDLTSDVFLKAFDARDSFKEGSAFQSWIYAIAHNTLVSHYRKQGRFVSLEQIENVPDQQNLESLTDIQLETERLFILLERMPDNQRHLILLRHVDELSFKEISGLLGKSEGAIRTALSRAIGNLKALATQSTNI
ncbi:RNA polymerase sigma factor [Candidatus Nomurabacteria bacterium]|nr:RNA polymerase sigma factor [Candidatus Nomurabacteria bacterium]